MLPTVTTAGAGVIAYSYGTGPVLGFVRIGVRNGVACYLQADRNAPAGARNAWSAIGPVADYADAVAAADAYASHYQRVQRAAGLATVQAAPVEPVASVVGEAPARARYAPVYNPAGTGGYDITDRETGSTDINGARHWFGDLHFAQKACDALNAGRPCPTMAEMCEAVPAPPEATEGAAYERAARDAGWHYCPKSDAWTHDAFEDYAGDAEEACEMSGISPAPAMVPQPVQQQQARARGRAPQPARGERRYVTVRDTETGNVHRVLTSVAQVGVAVVIFIPSNRHRQGALGGMLITHDDIRKAWVFNDEAEARRMLSRNRAPGERVIRAELVADPAPAIVPLGGRYVALADGGVEWVADAPTMVPQPAQQQQAKAGATLSDAPKDEQFADAARAKLGDSDGFEVDADAAVSRGSGEPGGAFVACWVWVSNDEASA